MSSQTEFDSLKDIKEKYNIEVDSPEKIRKCLWEQLANLHPDNNTEESTEEEFMLANSALEYVDKYLKNQGNDLLPAEESNEIRKHLKELVTQDKENNLKDDLKNKVDNNYENITNKFKLPRITLTSITSIITSLWVLPSKIKDHYILKDIVNIDSTFFKVGWSIIFLITIIFWIYSSWEKNKQQILKSNLHTEAFQNKLFESFIDNLYGKDFTKDKFIFYLTNGIKRYNRKGFLDKIKYNKKIFGNVFSPIGNIDIEVAEKLANLVFERAESNNIIKETDKKTLAKTYVLHDDFEKSDKWYI